MSREVDHVALPSYRDEIGAFINHLDTHGQGEALRLHLDRPSDPVPVELSGIKFTFREDTRYLISAQDLTRTINYENKLRAKIAEANQAAEAKNNFLASISHELRTPLHSICGIAEILENKIDSPEEKSLVHLINRNGNHLIMMINDLLDLTQSAEESISLSPVPTDIEQLIHDVVETLVPLAKDKTLYLDVTNISLKRKIRLVDPRRLKQVLINIIGNSIKFSEKGVIKILANESEDIIFFQVSDNGIGIPQDKLNVIFEPFVQADGTITRKYGGSGLGLAITKKIVERMNGKIELESELHQGTTFRIILPLSESLKNAANKNQTHHKMTLPYSRILIADDAQDNLLLLKLYLQDHPVEIDTTPNGKEALEMMKEKSYDLVIMDIQMPEMDGITATHHYRLWELDQGQKRPKTLIIALTADVLTFEHHKYLELGFSGYLTKPIKQTKLIEELFLVLEEQKSLPST